MANITAMRYALYLILFTSLSCSKPTPVSPPTDDIDSWTGQTWERYGFKSPVNNKEVYYYLTFKKNQTFDNYIRYNRTEAPTSVETGTYISNKAGFSFTLNGVSFPGTFTSDGKLILSTSAGSLTYTKK